MMRVNNLQKLNWRKNWAGQWSLLESCFWGRAYTKLLKDHIGVGLKNALFTFQEGASANYLVAEQLDKFGRSLARKYFRHPRELEKWVKRIRRQRDRAMRFMEIYRRQQITFADTRKLWGILDDYLVINFPIKRVADFLPPQVLEEYLPMFEQIRIYGEPVYMQSHIFMQSFAWQMAKRTHIPSHLLLCLTLEELEQYFSNHSLPKKQDLMARYRHSILLFENGSSLVLAGPKTIRLAKGMTIMQRNKEVITGTAAYGGRVRGIVRVIIDPKNVTSYKPGSILVTGMTRPEFLPLMKISAAVVTDTGGVLSHAAITARELKIPTITGTEIGSKVLQDGDRVEVDANNGIVRKLTK